MDASTTQYRIELLKGPDHYPVWKILMTDILTDQGLWEYVSGVMRRLVTSTEFVRGVEVVVGSRYSERMRKSVVGEALGCAGSSASACAGLYSSNGAVGC